MKLPYTIALAAVGLTCLVAVLNCLPELSFINFAVNYGLFGCLTGGICLLTAIALLIINRKYRALANGFFLAAGILLLTGFFGISQIEFSR